MNEKLFRIKEVSEKTGVHPQTLRNWEKEGLIEPLRISGNHRLYTEKDVKRVEEIIQLKDEGLKIKGIHKVLLGKPFSGKPKGKPGRPKGRKTTETLATAAAPVQEPKKKRGRKPKVKTPSISELENMRLEELIEIAKQRGIKYFRQMHKYELMTAIAHPEREEEMHLQAKERTKRRYGDKVYGKRKEEKEGKVMEAAQKQEEAEGILTENEAEDTELVMANEEQSLGEEELQQQALIQEILKLGDKGKNPKEIAKILVKNYKK